jgi:hypothetical protein
VSYTSALHICLHGVDRNKFTFSTTPRNLACRDRLCWCRYQCSIRSLAQQSSFLLSGAIGRKCPSLCPCSVIRARADRFSEFGLGSSSILLFRISGGRLTGCAWCCGRRFFFIIFMVSIPGKCFCFVLISLELLESKYVKGENCFVLLATTHVNTVFRYLFTFV